jgi:mono/diheme cytochrome c family protein
MRSFWRFAAGAVLLTLVAVFGLFAFLRTHGFSAREKPTALEAFIARRVRRLAMPRAVRELRNPIKPSPLAVAEGRDHFADHCAICHANDGSGRAMINEGLYPPAPDLRDAWTQGLGDGEIFAVIKNGIRFTGMPGWGGADEDNWKLVLFIRHLPELSSEERRMMVELNGLE